MQPISPIEGLGVRLHNADNPLLAFVEVVEAPPEIYISTQMFQLWLDGQGRHVRIRKMGERDTRVLVVMGTEGYGAGVVSYVIDFHEPLRRISDLAYVARRVGRINGRA
jgi:hypothetical protein